VIRFFSRRRQRGQSLVEFSLIIPIILTLTMAIAEFGVAFGTNMSMIEATREGARVGAILVDGSNSLGCPGYPGSANVDPQIIASVQRVVESPGSGIAKDKIDYIRIYAYTNPGVYNEWRPGGTGLQTICGVKLDFFEFSNAWAASGRANTLPVDSIGVSIQYRYQLFTPLSALTGMFGLSQITMVDSTVMAFEP
jgi:hypothetical protein